MICPVCTRDLAPTLSICWSCGTMMNDSVREELETKIGPAVESVKIRIEQNKSAVLSVKEGTGVTARSNLAAPPAATTNSAAGTAEALQPKPQPKNATTNNLANKKTSPTLVEFQSRNAAVPDWRLQLQNAVRQRARTAPNGDGQPALQKQLVTVGAGLEENKPETIANTTLANALKRIEESRKAFLPTESKKAVQKTGRSYPFNIVTRAPSPSQKSRESKTLADPTTKPRLLSSLKIEKKKYDTNKLPPLPKPPFLSSSFDSTETVFREQLPESARESVPASQKQHLQSQRLEIRPPVNEPKNIDTQEVETEEFDDLAPYSMRFGSALFDFIIGGFSTLLLLSPFMFSGGSWLSVFGVLTAGASFALVMFVYLTASIGFVGRTVGMKLFSLEIIDAEENEYPTLHQAAVSSAVFLLSILFGGIGFLPALFNEEKRAAHDLLSGTILVREC